MATKQICFIHCGAADAGTTEKTLANAGFTLAVEGDFTTASMRLWRAAPPWAFVIDLSRLPSRGREIAIALRQSPKTRTVPILFLNGDPAKVAVIRSIPPDALYAVNKTLLTTLQHAQPTASPARPTDMMNRYAARTVAEKLGIKAATSVAAIDPPNRWERLLGALPSGVSFVEQDAAVTLLFVHSVDELRSRIAAMRAVAATTKLWIVWQKKGAPGHAGIMEPLVREIGIDLGLVDYKICAIDSHWSAMAFARRKA